MILGYENKDILYYYEWNARKSRMWILRSKELFLSRC